MAVDPKLLMHWVDNWRDSDPGKILGQPLKLIAHQVIKRFLRRKVTHNWIYQIGEVREIVYKPYPLSPAVMKMGVSGRTWQEHPKSVPMSVYAHMFLGPNENDESWKDRVERMQWLKRNSYELV